MYPIRGRGPAPERGRDSDGPGEAEGEGEKTNRIMMRIKGGRQENKKKGASGPLNPRMRGEHS